MSSTALVLVLTAAVLHATWNYWAKKAGGGLPFVYLIGIFICVGYVPVLAIYCSSHPVELAPAALGAIFVSGVLKTVYSLFLQRAYRDGDFSLIYPLARGAGPLISAAGAILLFGERPTALALTGAAGVIAGIFWLAGGHRWLVFALKSSRGTAGTNPITTSAVYGILSGVCIATYTLWDKHGISHLAIAPIVYDAGTAFTQLVLLGPLAWKRRAELRQEWRTHRFHAFVIAAVAPLAYILVLTAMQTTPVSYVAPTREVSILIGMLFGAHFLKEAEAVKRLFPATLIIAGVFALALG